jgi:hypothetical protein
MNNNSSPCYQTVTLPVNNNKRAREGEITQEYVDDQLTVDHLINPRKQRKTTDLLNPSTDKNSSLKVYEEIPKTITEDVIKTYAQNNELGQLTALIPNVKSVNLNELGQLTAKYLQFNHLYDVAIEFADDFVSNVKCNVPRCSAPFWCDHVAAVLLKCIKSPNTVLREKSMTDFLIMAQNEQILAQAVLKLLTKCPLHYEDLTKYIQEVRENNRSCSSTSARNLYQSEFASDEVIELNIPSTGSKLSHYINYNAI